MQEHFNSSARAKHQRLYDDSIFIIAIETGSITRKI